MVNEERKRKREKREIKTKISQMEWYGSVPLMIPRDKERTDGAVSVDAMKRFG